MPGIMTVDLVLLVLVVVVVVSKLGGRRLRRACRSVVSVAVVRPPAVPRPRPRAVEQGREGVETALAAMLVAGQLPRRAYQQRMAELAAADALCRPLAAPVD